MPSDSRHIESKLEQVVGSCLEKLLRTRVAYCELDRERTNQNCRSCANSFFMHTIKTLTFYTIATLLTTPATAQDKGKAKTSSLERPSVVHAHYFDDVKQSLMLHWPKNRIVRFVFHGHSVPAGYFKTPTIRRFDSYPVLFHQELCELYSTAVIDVCTTAIGGENSQSGADRFAEDVLALKPDVVFIDYCLNDRRIGIDKAEQAWRKMIRQALNRKVKVVLLTPTPDSREDILSADSNLAQHARSIRRLGSEFGIPVVDSFEAFRRQVADGADVSSYLSQPNHPNRNGHEVVAGLILDLFR